MKKLIFAVLLCTAVSVGQTDHPKNAFKPGEIQWGPPPPFVALARNSQCWKVTLASSGDYTIRDEDARWFKIAPHWHPKRENVTVLRGTFKVGMGDTFDTSKMGDFVAGSFAYMDPEMHHYVMASGETVVQVHGQSPVVFNYVNPADDPSKK